MLQPSFGSPQIAGGKLLQLEDAVRTSEHAVQVLSQPLDKPSISSLSPDALVEEVVERLLSRLPEALRASPGVTPSATSEKRLAHIADEMLSLISQIKQLLGRGIVLSTNQGLVNEHHRFPDAQPDHTRTASPMLSFSPSSIHASPISRYLNSPHLTSSRSFSDASFPHTPPDSGALPLPSPPRSSPTPEIDLPLLPPSIHGQHSIPLADPSPPKMLQTLRTVLQKPHIRWTLTGQRRAVEECVRYQSDVIVILPTGSGKSAIVPTAAALESNLHITVVVCPLTSLLHDWGRRLAEMNVPFQIFDPTNPRITAIHSIIIVSLDVAVGDKFRLAVRLLQSPRTIRRYVIDEAHLIFSESSYRNVMRSVSVLRSEHPVQMVLLSATIPPTAVDGLAQTVCLSKGYVVIREATNRPELQFVLRPDIPSVAPEVISRAHGPQSTTANPRSPQHIQHLIAEIKGYRESLGAGDRILVFVRRYEDGHHLAHALLCDFYRGSGDERLSDHERKTMVQQWRAGSSSQRRVLIATEAFGPGNDYPSVRFVYVIGAPDGIVQFHQLAGRGGRDGNPCVVNVFPIRDSHLPASPSQPHIGTRELHSLFSQKNTRCWRSVISGLLDGDNHYCSDSDRNLLCSACTSQLTSQPSVQASPSNATPSPRPGSHASLRLTESSSTHVLPTALIRPISPSAERPVSKRARPSPPNSTEYSSTHAASCPDLTPSLSSRQTSSSCHKEISPTLASLASRVGATRALMIGQRPASTAGLPFPQSRTHEPGLRSPSSPGLPQSPALVLPSSSHSFSSPFARATSNVRQHKIQEDRALQDLVEIGKSALNKVKGLCAMCLALSGETVPHHKLFDCATFQHVVASHSSPDQIGFYDRYRPFKANIRYHRGGLAVCYKCHIPFLKDRLHPAKSRDHVVCDPQHDDLVRPTVFLVYLKHPQALSAKFERSWQDEEEFASWLSESPTNMSFTNVFSVFVWAVENLVPSS